MQNFDNELIIRRSISVLVLEIFTIQLVVIIAYLVLRISKFWLLGELMAETDVAEINFWLGIVVFIVLIFAQASIIIAVVLKWWFERYEITIESIIHKRGVFRSREDIYSLKNIEAGKVSQNVFGKIFNFGTVAVFSPVLKSEYFIRDISNPYLIKNFIVELIDDKIEEKDRKIIPRDISNIL